MTVNTEQAAATRLSPFFRVMDDPAGGRYCSNGIRAEGGAEVEFVSAVSAGGSVKFLPFSIFTHFLCFFLLKPLKLGEIDGVKNFP